MKWETRDPKSREGFVWPWKRTSLYSSSPSVFCGTFLAASVKLEATVLSIHIGLIGNVLPIIAHCHLPVVGSSNDPAQNKSLIKTCLDSLGLFLTSFSLFCVTWTVRVRWCSPSGWPAVAPRLPWPRAVKQARARSASYPTRPPSGPHNLDVWLSYSPSTTY